MNTRINTQEGKEADRRTKAKYGREYANAVFRLVTAAGKHSSVASTCGRIRQSRQSFRQSRTPVQHRQKRPS